MDVWPFVKGQWRTSGTALDIVAVKTAVALCEVPECNQKTVVGHLLFIGEAVQLEIQAEGERKRARKPKTQ